MTATTNRRAGLLLLAASLGMLLLLMLLVPGLTPLSTPAAAATDPTVASQECKLHFYANDPGKESEYSFGPAVASRDGAGIKADLHERRLCGKDLRGDPALTAAHYAGWSAKGLTTEKLSFAGVNAFAARLIGDFPLWESTVAEMESLESVSALSLGSVLPRTPSLYMVAKTTGGVEVRQGLTIGDGSAVVFAHPSGAVVKFRLDCGFQNVGDSFPGVKLVPAGSVELMPLPKPKPTPPAVPPTTSHKPPPCRSNCGGLEQKKVEQDVGSNKAVTDWKKDTSHHKTSTADGAEVSNGYQADPAADAAKAKAAAAAQQAANAAAAAAAQKAAKDTGGGVVDENQEHTAAPAPDPGW